MPGSDTPALVLIHAAQGFNAMDTNDFWYLSIFFLGNLSAWAVIKGLDL